MFTLSSMHHAVMQSGCHRNCNAIIHGDRMDASGYGCGRAGVNLARRCSDPS